MVSELLKQEPLSIRPSLVEEDMKENSVNDFQCFALLLLDHVDVLCNGLLQYAMEE